MCRLTVMHLTFNFPLILFTSMTFMLGFILFYKEECFYGLESMDLQIFMIIMERMNCQGSLMNKHQDLILQMIILDMILQHMVYFGRTETIPLRLMEHIVSIQE